LKYFIEIWKLLNNSQPPPLPLSLLPPPNTGPIMIIKSILIPDLREAPAAPLDE